MVQAVAYKASPSYSRAYSIRSQSLLSNVQQSEDLKEHLEHLLIALPRYRTKQHAFNLHVVTERLL